MKIFDMHIHAAGTEPKPEALLAKMEATGVQGGCIFSCCPYEFEDVDYESSSFEERLAELQGWTDGYRDRLFPVMWIHPYEKDIEKNIYKAIDQGVMAFKIICNNFYVYEDASMHLLSSIAEAGKPVFFHSGILWDRGISAKYNRPINWEPLMTIKNLRFSMAHCSWPWYDECIAVYGKLKYQSKVREDASEMFLDLAPGTPPAYRRDLFTKLFSLGMHNNILYGSDSFADEYNGGHHVEHWLQRDQKIFDDLGVPEAVQAKVYSENLMRFLGLTTQKNDSEDIWQLEIE